MGTKVKIAGLVGAQRFPDSLPTPQPGARLTGLYLVALRSHVAHSQPLAPARKIKIQIQTSGGNHVVPQKIKITHS